MNLIVWLAFVAVVVAPIVLAGWIDTLKAEKETKK